MDIRYNKLKEDHAGLTNQHGEATKLIEEMKKSSKGNEELQGKITAYETQVGQADIRLLKTIDNGDNTTSYMLMTFDRNRGYGQFSYGNLTLTPIVR